MTIRALTLASAASLFLAGCGGGDQQANNTVNIDQAVLSDELAANDVTAIEAQCRTAARRTLRTEARRATMMGMTQDLRYAVRTLKHSPGYTSWPCSRSRSASGPTPRSSA